MPLLWETIFSSRSMSVGVAVVARGSDRGSDRGSLAPNGENQAQTRQADAGTSGSSMSYVGNCFFCDGCCGRFTTTHTPYTHRRMQTHVHMYTFSVYTHTHARRCKDEISWSNTSREPWGAARKDALHNEPWPPTFRGISLFSPAKRHLFSRKATATAVAAQWWNTRLIRTGPNSLPRACCKPAAASGNVIRRHAEKLRCCRFGRWCKSKTNAPSTPPLLKSKGSATAPRRKASG